MAATRACLGLELVTQKAMAPMNEPRDCPPKLSKSMGFRPHLPQIGMCLWRSEIAHVHTHVQGLYSLVGVGGEPAVSPPCRYVSHRSMKKVLT